MRKQSAELILFCLTLRVLLRIVCLIRRCFFRFKQKQAALIHQLQDELHCQYELSRTIRNTEIQSVPREEYEATRIERDRFVCCKNDFPFILYFLFN